MGRAPCCDKTDVKKGSWSSEEDAKLKDYIEKYGTGGNWIALPQKSGLKRCGKSCRLRWLNYLRPNIKHGGFSEEEDNIICSLYISIGSRWSIIAAQLPGRTDNDIKNYWNTRLKKKFLGGHKESQVNGNMRESKGIETLRNLAFERPQLHMQHQSLKNSNLHHYDNAPLWSCKLKPIKEKMMQKVEYHAQSNNPLQQECSPVSSLMINGMGNYMGINTPTSSSVISKSDVTKQPPSMELQWCWAFQAEIDDLMNNRPQLSTEFDCFKDMDGAKDSTSWWCNEFEANSNTWYSNGVLDHKQEVPRISERTYRV